MKGARKGPAVKEMRKEEIRVHKVLGIERARYDTIGVSLIRVLEWEKSGKRAKSLFRVVNETIEGRESSG